MGEINYTPFEEEDSFNATNINARFTDVKSGVDALVMDAFDRGCLNESHLPSFVVFSGTIEFNAADIGAKVYTCNWDPGTSTQQGACYWNDTDSAAANRMGYPPNDGTWAPIEDSVGNDLQITFPDPIDLTGAFNDRFGVSQILVLLNVEVEKIELFEQGTQTLTDSDEGLGCAVAIQIQNENSDWKHIYLGDSTYTVAPVNFPNIPPYRYRVTERRMSQVNPDGQVIGGLTKSRTSKDISLRTIINASSQQNTVNGQNVKTPSTQIKAVRAVVSIIKKASGGLGLNPFDNDSTLTIKSANLTVIALRASSTVT